MAVISLCLGVVLLLVAVVDLLWTALWAQSAAGPLSARVTTLLWRAFRRLNRRTPGLLSLGGPLILVVTLSAWILAIWTGWTLVFAAGEDSIVATSGIGSVSWTDRVYFVGYSFFTLGNGDFRPAAGWPQMATVLVTATGMVVLTLGVTYLVSVVRATAQKRAFATTVTGLGQSPPDLVVAGWNGRDLHDLDLPFSRLASDLALLAELHQAFPILHYYHSRKKAHASAFAVAVLDEALTLLRHGVAAEDQVNGAVVQNVRSSIDIYVDSLSTAYIKPAADAPSPPDLSRLREAGIPTIGEDDFHAAVDNLRDRRQKLLGLIEADAWEWSS